MSTRGVLRTFDVVLFDVDDTLYEVADLVKASWRLNPALLHGAGLDPAAVCVVYDRERPGRRSREAIASTVAALGHPPALAQGLCEVLDGPIPDRLPARPGARALLRALRASGIGLGVVTNGQGPRQRAKLAALGMTDLFDVVVIAGDEGIPAKPALAPFRVAVEALGVPAHRVLMVGDRPDFDVAPAVKLGMGAVRLIAGHYATASSHPGTLWEGPSTEQAWAQIRALTV